MEFVSIRFFDYICSDKKYFSMENKDFDIKNGILTKYHGIMSHVVIPNGVTEIGADAFYFCESLRNVKLSDSVTSIGDSAFACCENLTSIEIPNSVTNIGNASFAGCFSLKNITIPSSVTNIGNSAFAACAKLTSIEIPNSVRVIRDFSFNGCTSLKSITIPNGVTKIGEGAFYDCSNLQNVTIPNSVTDIGMEAFSYCTSLTCIDIPNSVKFIDGCAFHGIKEVKPQYNSNGSLRAFKAFNEDWTCRDFQYEVGKSYHQYGKINCCSNGFHACTNPLNVFIYYRGNLNTLHFAEVEISGDIDWEEHKVAASDIRIIRELTATDLAEIYNKMEK